MFLILHFSKQTPLFKVLVFPSSHVFGETNQVYDTYLLKRLCFGVFAHPESFLDSHGFFICVPAHTNSALVGIDANCTFTSNYLSIPRWQFFWKAAKPLDIRTLTIRVYFFKKAKTVNLAISNSSSIQKVHKEERF